MSPLSKMATDLPNVSIYLIRENHTPTSSITLVNHIFASILIRGYGKCSKIS